ncbi:DENN domain-containing protein 1A-like isoform X1 [Anastrepha ludens]|uniref:DENN domain-containing protein 1A-like isoform X1 n=2 Tax=Anastrepha ludens TaxID=28586 RepID=UPI0023AED218|nr:DENN domain-containing protein 1A-like isoform X1 [Anastrepha ludens]
MSNNLAGIPGTRVHADVDTLFDAYCELHFPVGNTRSTNKHNSGSISETFPANFRDNEILKMLQLCAAVPCEFENESVLMYSFVLTSEDSHWRFCFCRHDFKAKYIMVILTRLPWHDAFVNILATLADLKAQNSTEFSVFRMNCYKAPVPNRGEITLVPVGTDRKVFSLEQPSFYKLPTIPENHNLTIFHNFATPNIMLSIIVSLIFERRIIITSRYPDRHSACVQAANTLLYPMEWQHTYIPILPAQLSDYLSGSMPFLIGVPLFVLETICRGELGDVIIFNCDAGTYESCYNDVQLLPKRVLADMQKKFRNTQEMSDEYISYVFLLMMVHLIGQYRDGIKFKYGTPFFCEFAFLSKCHPTKRPFLRRFLPTPMCVHFINTRLGMLKQESMIWDRFEMESALHSQRKNKSCWAPSKKKYKKTDEIYAPRNSLQNHLLNAIEVTESIKLQLKDLRKSREYKNAKAHTDVRELFESIRHLLAFAISAYRGLQAQNEEEMNNLGYTEISTRTRTSEPSKQDKGRTTKPSSNRPFG